MGRHAEGLGQHPLEPVGNLGRGPHAEAAARVGLGEHASGLHRHAGVALHPEPPSHDDRRLAERARGVAELDPERHRDIVAPLGMDQRGVGGEPALGIRHDGERLPLDLDELPRVFSRVAIQRHHHRDRLAHVARPAARERVLGRGPELEADARLERRRRRPGGGQGHHPGPEVLEAEDADDGRMAPGPLAPDGGDPRVRVGAPEQDGVEAVAHAEVVHVPPVPGEQPGILHAADPGPDVPGAHGPRGAGYAKPRTTCLAMRSIWRGSSVTGPSTRYLRPASIRSWIRALIRSMEPTM